MKKVLILLGAVFVLALVLRMPRLSVFPVGFTPDEAAFGYNAYSLFLSGKDEWGTPFFSLPIVNLKSFGDYKLPLYSFLVVPLLPAIGLNEVATRLPNAFLGSLAVFPIFALAYALTKNKKVSLVSSVLLAFTPWHVALSRGAFEANLITFLYPLSLLLYFKRRPFLSSLFLALTFYSYHSGRFLVLPAFLLQIIFYRQYFQKRYLIYLLAFLLPGLSSLFGLSLSRAADVAIFHPTDNWQSLSQLRFRVFSAGWPDFVARLIYNKPLFVLSEAMSRYLSYFSPQSLFATGPAETTYGLLPGSPLLSLPLLPAILSLIYFLIKKPTRYTFFIIALLLLTPLPAAFSKGPGFSANRTALLAPLFCLAAAFGVMRLNRRLLLLFLSTTFIFSLYSVFDYTFRGPLIMADGMLYGRRELFSQLKQMDQLVPEVRLSRTLSEPHIYLAFYYQIPPAEYQTQALNWPALGANGITFLDQTKYSYGKYQFDSLSFGGDDPRTLLVGRPQDFAFGYPLLFTINSPAGNPLIQVSPLKL